MDEVDKTANSLTQLTLFKTKTANSWGSTLTELAHLKALRENGVDPKGKNVLLLGAGGAARAIAYSLCAGSGRTCYFKPHRKPAEELASSKAQ